jgi:hypothetical protein
MHGFKNHWTQSAATFSAAIDDLLEQAEKPEKTQRTGHP